MRAPAREERRRCPRRPAGECAWVSHARLRHGLELLVINLGLGGACVEAPARLLPGSSVELHLGAPGWRWSASARVLRCHVSALLPERGVRYRAALQFDQPLTPPWSWAEEEHGHEAGGRVFEPNRRRVPATIASG